jgi:hypothetical protein
MAFPICAPDSRRQTQRSCQDENNQLGATCPGRAGLRSRRIWWSCSRGRAAARSWRVSWTCRPVPASVFEPRTVRRPRATPISPPAPRHELSGAPEADFAVEPARNLLAQNCPIRAITAQNEAHKARLRPSERPPRPFPTPENGATGPPAGTSTSQAPHVRRAY